VSVQGRYILISGSASDATALDLLTLTHAVVEQIVVRILDDGGGLVLLVGADPKHREDNATSIVLEWTVLQAVRAYADERDPVDLAARVRIVATSSDRTRIPGERQRLYDELLKRGIVVPHHISEDDYFGGEIRKALSQHSDALLAVGGGKGVTHLGALHTKAKKPIIPIHVEIGSSCSDGEGSRGIFDKALVEPATCFPVVTDAIRAALPQMRLTQTTGAAAFAGAAADLLSTAFNEMDQRLRAEVQAAATSDLTKVEIMNTKYAEQRIKPFSRDMKEADFLVEAADTGDEVRKRILRTVEQFGVCLLRISGHDAAECILESLGSTLGDVMEKQNFFEGRYKHIKPSNTGKLNSGDTARDIGLHVDGTQHETQPVLLMFQYVTNAKMGGESIFVDAARVLSDLPDEARIRVLTNLSRTDAATFRKEAAGNELNRLKAEGRDTVMTFTGPLFWRLGQGLGCRLRFDEIIDIHPECQADYEMLRGLFNQKKYELRFVPRDGDIVIFDNARLLHARDEVLGARQREHYRMWIEALSPGLRGDVMLGVRPVDYEILVSLKPVA
jgi:alpha-ketoglutarate-dependent taurine dioxygenase